MTRNKFIQVCLVLGCLLQAPAVLAQTEARNLQVLARTLGFMDPPMKGRLRVGILYDPASTAAHRDANALSGLFAGGLRTGGLTLEARLVPIGEANEADVDLFLLSKGNGERAAALVPILKARKLPCLSTDLDQVRAGHCTVGLQSAPRVEILLNTRLAADSNTAFASVFRMMIKEL
jgi:hypothetical protein